MDEPLGPINGASYSNPVQGIFPSSGTPRVREGDDADRCLAGIGQRDTASVLLLQRLRKSALDMQMTYGEPLIGWKGTAYPGIAAATKECARYADDLW
jgi:hypothetical protein